MPASSERRERLLSPVTLILMAGVVIAALALLFPRGRKGIENVPLDGVAVPPLDSLEQRLLTHPEERRTRLALARAQLERGRLDEAEATLGPLFSDRDGEVRLPRRLLALDLLVARRSALPEGDPRRAERTTEILRLAGELSREAVSADRRERLARLMLELGHPESAAEVYRRLADEDPARHLPWLERAARWHLAAGQPERAAADLRAAAAAATSDGAALAFELRAASALVSADRGGAALLLLDELLAPSSRFARSAPLLERGVQIARARSDGRRALAWAERRRLLEPRSPAHLEELLRVQLAFGHIREALRSARELAALRGSARDHRRVAQLAEWNDQGALALPHWAWLARRFAQPEVIDHAMDLARMLHDQPLALELLLLRLRRGNPTHDDLAVLLTALEEGGRPEEAVLRTREYLARVPSDRASWEALAWLLERTGDLRGSLDTWEQIEGRFGTDGNLVTQEGELLWRLDRAPEALTRLSLYAARAADDDRDFWTLLGEIAWSQEAHPEALRAYLALYRLGGSDDPEVGQRLLALLREGGEPDQLLALGPALFARYRVPELLVSVMDVAAQRREWTRLRGLIAKALASGVGFDGNESFWLMRAELAEHDGRHAEARRFYQRALAIQPRLDQAEIGILLALVEEGDRRELEAALRRDRAEADQEPVYWPVYALALAHLGRADEALRWYERAARAHPDDAEVLAGWAEALAKSGHETAAWRLRGFLVEKLRPRALDAARHLSREADRDVVREYALLLHQARGPVAAASWIAKLRAAAPDDPKVAELTVTWYLDQGEHAAAEALLARMAARRHPGPASQRMTIALASNDLPTVARILEQDRRDLSRADRIEAETRLGMDEAAWAEAVEGLRLHDTDDDPLALRETEDELAAHLATRVEARWTLDGLGPLTADRHQVEAALHARGGFGVSGRVAFVDLHGDPAQLRVDRIGRGATELDAAIGGSWRQRHGRLVGTLGVDVRADRALPYGRLEETLRLAEAIELRLALGVGELSDDGAALRLAGQRSQIAATLEAQLGARGYLDLTGGAHQLRGRDWAMIGQGALVEAELGYKISLGHPEWRVHLSGEYQRNVLEPSLPGSVAALLPDGTQPSAVLPAEYAQAGVGASLSQGDASDGTRRSGLRYLVDVWVGWAFPPHHLAYHLRAGIGWAIARAGMLSVAGYYGNDFVGGGSESFEGVQILYAHRFGR